MHCIAAEIPVVKGCGTYWREEGGVGRNMKIRFLVMVVGMAGVLSWPASGQNSERGTIWQFAVSGDSRNCGDVIMPAIAHSVLAQHASFYWHLGDFRAIYRLDEDYAQQQLAALRAANPKKADDILLTSLPFRTYTQDAWPDFIRHQLAPFGDLPVFLGVGNHEMIPPMTHDGLLMTFGKWLDSPMLREQRLHDDPTATPPQSYYHWHMRGVDFVNMDNSAADDFSPAQMDWLGKILTRADHDADVKAIVVGMHKALPDSFSFGHSMNETPRGTATGRTVYAMLLEAQNKFQKHVYVLASHSHFFMGNIYNTACWRKNGGVIPGWIVGTAGAPRYRLPEDISGADVAVTDVYGYLLGTVHTDGVIDFQFHQVDENSLPKDDPAEKEAMKEFSPQFITWCFRDNRELSYRPDKLPDCPR
jgi:hypothetical protein